MRALSELFAEAGGTIVDWEGTLLYAVYEIVPRSNALVIEFAASNAGIVEGVRMKLKGGQLVANGVAAEELLLWNDTSPLRVEVRVEVGKGGSPRLKMWNVWRGGMDVVQAWLGNAAMRVEHVGGSTVLHCSDGVGPIDFDNLKVRLTWR